MPSLATGGNYALINLNANTHPASFLPGHNPKHSTTFRARGVGNLM